MAKPRDVLLFGHDALLQSTRAAILHKDGFRVDSVANLGELQCRLAARPYALLLLCHSLRAVERDTGAALAASFFPAVRVLALQRYAAGAFERSFVQVSHIQSGPEEFRSAVRALANPTEVLTH